MKSAFLFVNTNPVANKSFLMLLSSTVRAPQRFVMTIVHRKATLLLLVILLFFKFNYAQWIQTNGPIDMYIYSITTKGTMVFAGTSNGVSLSSDEGMNWLTNNTGLGSGNVYALNIKGSNLFAGVFGAGVFKSNDNGANWSMMNNGLGSTSVFALASLNTHLYAGTDSGVYITADNGAHWLKAVNGIVPGSSIVSLATSDSGVYAGTLDGKIYSSSDNGVSWITQPNLDHSSAINSLSTNNSGIYAGTGEGLYFLSYGDSTWTDLSNSFSNTNILSVVTLDSIVIAASHSIISGFYFSPNNGKNWKTINNGFLIYSSIMSLAVNAKYAYTGIEALSIWRRSISEIMDIPETLHGSETEFYPNPANDNLLFRTTEYGMTADIMTLDGINVLSGKPGTSKSIDISRLSKGVYLVKLTSDQGVVFRKLIKQ